MRSGCGFDIGERDEETAGDSQAPPPVAESQPSFVAAHDHPLALAAFADHHPKMRTFGAVICMRVFLLAACVFDTCTLPFG